MSNPTEAQRKPAEITMPELYLKQGRAVFSPARYSIIEASTKAGKTLGCLVWQGTMCLRDPNAMNHWWVAPVYAQAEIAYYRAKKMFGSICHSVDSKRTLRFQNGAIWFFKSGEKPDNLYGEDVATLVIDEFTRVREASWFALRTTISATRGPVRMIGNVKGRGTWGYKMARKAEAGEIDQEYHKITAQDAIDAGVLEYEEVEDAGRILPRAIYRELYFCEPSDGGGNPFGLDCIAACIRHDTGALGADGKPIGDFGTRPIVFGVDLAKHQDWTVVIGLDHTGYVSVLERFQKIDWPTQQRRIVALTKGRPTLIDQTGIGDVVFDHMLKVHGSLEGMKFTPGPTGTKQQMIQGLIVAIQQGDISFDPGVLVNELESFEYQVVVKDGRVTNIKYTAPEGMHDDCVMALALVVHRRQFMDRMALDARAHGTGDSEEQSDEDRAFQDDRGDEWWQEKQWGGGGGGGGGF